MAEFTKVLLNSRSLRATTKELTIEQLEQVSEKLAFIIQERRDYEAAKEATQREKENKLSELMTQLNESGIDSEELVAFIQGEGKKPKTKRQPLPPKYSFEQDGVLKTWTGQGRMPSFLKEVMDETGSIEKYLI